MFVLSSLLAAGSAWAQFLPPTPEQQVAIGQQQLVQVEAQFGASSPQFGEALRQFAVLQRRARRYDDAVRTASRALSILEAKLGSKHDHVKTARMTVEGLKRANELDDAARAEFEAADERLTNLRLTAARNPLQGVDLRKSLEDLAAIEGVFTRVFGSVSTAYHLGVDDLRVMLARSILDPRERLRIRQQALTRFEERLGTGHFGGFHIHIEIAGDHLLFGRLDEAKRHLDIVERMVERAGGQADPVMMTVYRLSRAEVLHALGNFEDARRDADLAWALAETNLGRGHHLRARAAQVRLMTHDAISPASLTIWAPSPVSERAGIDRGELVRALVDEVQAGVDTGSVTEDALVRALSTLGRLQLASDIEAARKTLERARTIHARVKQGLPAGAPDFSIQPLIGLEVDLHLAGGDLVRARRVFFEHRDELVRSAALVGLYATAHAIAQAAIRGAEPKVALEVLEAAIAVSPASLTSKFEPLTELDLGAKALRLQLLARFDRCGEVREQAESLLETPASWTSKREIVTAWHTCGGPAEEIAGLLQRLRDEAGDDHSLRLGIVWSLSEIAPLEEARAELDALATAAAAYEPGERAMLHLIRAVLELSRGDPQVGRKQIELAEEIAPASAVDLRRMLDFLRSTISGPEQGARFIDVIRDPAFRSGLGAELFRGADVDFEDLFAVDPKIRLTAADSWLSALESRAASKHFVEGAMRIRIGALIEMKRAGDAVKAVEALYGLACANGCLDARGIQLRLERARWLIDVRRAVGAMRLLRRDVAELARVKRDIPGTWELWSQLARLEWRITLEAPIESILEALQRARRERHAVRLHEPERNQFARMAAETASSGLAVEVALARPEHAATIYQELILRKGEVLLDQARVRKSAPVALRDALRKATEDLQEAIRRGALGDDVRRLIAIRDTAERRLRKRLGPNDDVGDVGTLARLRARLKEGDVALDFFVYDGFDPSLFPERVEDVDDAEFERINDEHFVALQKGDTERPRHVMAFVVRRDRVAPVYLGSLRELTKQVDGWRRWFTPNGVARNVASVPAAGDHDPGPWLTEHVTKALLGPTDRRVYVSSTGPTARLPLGMLPGFEPGRRLLEEVEILYVPSIRLLVGSAKARSEERLRVVAVGDVAFDAETSTTTSSLDPSLRTSLGTFGRLPGTRREIDEIVKVLGIEQVERIDGKRATTTAVRYAAKRADVLHLATHGYFAPPEVRSTMEVFEDVDGGSATFEELLAGDRLLYGSHPALLSGLALAGANEGGRGLVTALDLVEWPLERARLVVLSACDTGLGETATGEGVVGLQRALHIAGADHVIASLWRVPDEDTARLMARFYELWAKGKQSPSAALRQAQRALMREEPDGRRAVARFGAWVVSGNRF